MSILRFVRAIFRPSRTRDWTGLRIIQGDICTQGVDAVVNAADGTLLGGTGVDAALRLAAGPGLGRACSQIGRLDTGDAAVTPGFNLRAKHVIHAVAPVWSGQDDRRLNSAFSRSLQLAQEAGCRSIALPLLGGGGFGWPFETACEVALTEIHDHLPNFAQIRLVLIDPDALDFTERHTGLHRIVQNADIPYVSDAVAFDEWK